MDKIKTTKITVGVKHSEKIDKQIIVDWIINHLDNIETEDLVENMGIDEESAENVSIEDVY